MNDMNLMRPQRRRVLLWSLLIGMSACATSPRTLTFSQADLTRWTQSRFPLERRMLDVLDITVSNPQFTLQSQNRRLAAVLDLSGKDRLFGRSFKGQLAFDGSLVFDADEKTIRLADVKVSQLNLDGLPPAVQSAAQGLGPALVQQMFERQPLYRFKPEDLQRAADAGLKPGALQITPRGIELTLVPLSATPVSGLIK